MTFSRWGAWVLVVAASLAIPVSVVAYWAVTTVTDANRYVATLSPLARQPAITNAIADRATNRLFASIPGGAHPLPTSQLRATARAQIASLLTTTSFQNTWDAAVRRSHPTAVAVLTGNSSTGATKPVVLNLTSVLDEALATLDARWITALDGFRPSLQGGQPFTVTVLSPNQVDESRLVFHAIVQWRRVLLVAAIVTVLGALALADRRRRILGGLAGGTAIATLAALGGLTVVRSVAVDRAEASHVNPDISTATFNVLVRYARVDLYITLGIAVALFVVVGLWSLIRPRRTPLW
ncbi:MAG TPA: hypothetical protein VHZ02_15795 [Acidimicrobiales bacterium]|nr:hypothetical protein [Acidimicrobiales bacterium]